MNKFIRYWNQNRGKIIITIAIIVFILFLIKIIDNIIAEQNKNTKDYLQNQIINKDTPIQSVITGTEISIEKAEKNKDIIQNFINLCNDKKIEEAYSLLSDSCKKNLFETVEVFKQNYYNNIFNTNKAINLELWLENLGIYTYKVTYYEDNLLATGGAMGETYEDYISIVKEQNEDKININNYIKEEQINKQQTISNIEINVNSKLIYKDYEIYNIAIKNNTDKDILISDGQNSKNICLVGENGEEYNSYIYELPINSLILKANYQKNINIKFNKIYSTYRNIEKMRFKDVILDYSKYIQNLDSTTINKINMDIDI